MNTRDQRLSKARRTNLETIGPYTSVNKTKLMFDQKVSKQISPRDLLQENVTSSDKFWSTVKKKNVSHKVCNGPWVSFFCKWSKSHADSFCNLSTGIVGTLKKKVFPRAPQTCLKNACFVHYSTT